MIGAAPLPPAAEGPHLRLRLVVPDDAAFIHRLRLDPALNAHLSPVTGSVTDQRDWITAYKTREAAGTEAYYLISRRDDGRPCGLVRLYAITDDNFTWGSFMLDPDTKPPRAALEAAILSFGIGFGLPGKTHALVDVRLANRHAHDFYRRLGMEEIRRDDRDVFMRYDHDRFSRDMETHMKVLARPAHTDARPDRREGETG